MKTIADRLLALRLALDLTQKSMAKPLSVTREAYSNYERGERDPPWPIGIEICNAWGVTLDWIYRGKMDGLPHDLRRKILAASSVAA
jgi:DNA-binding XRE family transcriptional regulator